MNDRFTTPWAELALSRFPRDPRDRLRAWDASDDYLLRHLADSGLPPAASVVIVGDRWGALTTALAARAAASGAEAGAVATQVSQVTQVTESFLTREATRANLAANGLAHEAASLLTTRDAPPERIDVLLVRVPKSLALLEDQLHRLAPALHRDTLVVGTGMVKEIHTSTLALFERIVGPTRTSLAERKARLLFATPGPAPERGVNPWPLRYDLPGDAALVAGRPVVNHAGVFCADRLDIGTRFFLRHLPSGPGLGRVVDLGCGNGVVGTAVALGDPDAEVIFTDESYQAVASAEETWRANGLGANAEFRVGDGLDGVPSAGVDLVLSNPPFHSHQATTDAIARRMFQGARRVLRPGGELWIVGNRHLGYHVTLRRVFGNSELVASDPKFVVLRAVRRG
jgi:16S rRNA (guanine1207-N2)-methyltransferase